MFSRILPVTTPRTFPRTTVLHTPGVTDDLDRGGWSNLRAAISPKELPAAEVFAEDGAEVGGAQWNRWGTDPGHAKRSALARSGLSRPLFTAGRFVTGQQPFEQHPRMIAFVIVEMDDRLEQQLELLGRS